MAAVGWVVGYAYRLDILPGEAAAWRVRDPRARSKDAARVEGLRRRMEGEAVMASGSSGTGGEGGGDGAEGGRRRTIGGQILDQFRGGN